MRFFKTITAFFMIFECFFAAMDASDRSVDENLRYQQERMDYLVNEYYVDYTPCDESKIAAFDIDQAIADGVKYNEVQFLATHNSYHTESTPEYKKLSEVLCDLTYGLIQPTLAQFEMDSLTEQFEVGIRSIEIDVETLDKNGDISFVVSHDPLIDNTSSCFDFKTALEEIKLWSDHNPGHLPITVIIEPKDAIPEIRNLKNFNVEYAEEMDKIIRETMGETLLTPADMMGNYESLKAMREADGWLPLEDTMGKVIFLLHDNAAISDYIKLDKSIKSQAMFPLLRYTDRHKSYTSFIIVNEPPFALAHHEESVEKCKLIVRTRADDFLSYSDKRYEQINACSSQIISTDYPPRKQPNEYHVYSFDGYTMKLQK
ncbi:MAG: hypothetical protein E7536_10395 [Ruminococcaceae bacterium]|nr:hypothetical protein [Oscillospiraceae bacterium]